MDIYGSIAINGKINPFFEGLGDEKPSVIIHPGYQYFDVHHQSARTWAAQRCDCPRTSREASVRLWKTQAWPWDVAGFDADI